MHAIAHRSHAITGGLVAFCLVGVAGCHRDPADELAVRGHARRTQSKQEQVRADAQAAERLAGTWFSPNACIVEWATHDTTWKLRADGTYAITARGSSFTEQGKWRVDNGMLVRQTKRGRVAYPYRLSSDGAQMTYGGRAGMVSSPEYVFVRQDTGGTQR